MLVFEPPKSSQPLCGLMAYTDPYTLGDSYPGPIHESAATMMLRLMMISDYQEEDVEDRETFEDVREAGLEIN